MSALSDRSVVVSFEPSREMRAAIDGTLAGLATITYLSELEDGERKDALSAADVLIAWAISGELSGAELECLGSAGLIRLLSAGVNHVPFGALPASVPVAANAGGWAEPMAEHVLAMALALAKRLPQNHAAMARGVFDQRTSGRELRGAVVAVLGYGGIGRASARLFRLLGHIEKVPSLPSRPSGEASGS